MFDRLRFTGTASRRLAIGVALAVCLVSLQCSRSPTTPSTGPTSGQTPPPVTPTLPPTNSGPFIFVGAGDIANCDDNSDVLTNKRKDWWKDASGATASLIDNIGGEVFTLGDNAYPRGLPADFNCYNQSWGRFLNRTHSTLGNHDYGDNTRAEANAYFNYFGSAAGDSGLGYYSFDRGAWHIISLNSNKDALGDNYVNANSPQATWLRQDLARSSGIKCTLAMWHHPLFSSGGNGDSAHMRPLFRILYEAGVDVVLAGHDHIYERFDPQDPDGRPDAARGIRQFIIGTGGTQPMTDLVTRKPNSAFTLTKTWGVVRFVLNADSYSWEFISTTNKTIDPGSASCH